MSEQTSDYYEFGRFRVKSDERVLKRGEDLVPLTPKAFDILLTLLENDGRIVSTQDVKLPADGESATVKVRFTANEAGARVFSFKIPTQTGEQVTQNNARDALIQINDRA